MSSIFVHNQVGLEEGDVKTGLSARRYVRTARAE